MLEHIPPLVRLRGVDKRFSNGTVALRGLDLDLARGSFVSLLGPSGCGKSTALRLIAGLGEPSSGSVDWGAETPPLSFVFQEPTLKPWRTVLGNVRLPLQIEVVSRRVALPRAMRALTGVGLAGFEN